MMTRVPERAARYPDPAAFEELLRESLERHLVGNGHSVPGHLAESIRYSLLAPGKRIRPRLALACGKMLGLPAIAAIAGAVALEMVHCFTLIHDDMPCMDDDDFRRGRPSNHRQFGEATALLAGDGLMAMAVDALLDADGSVPPPRLIAALRRLSCAMGARGVIGGQAAETLMKSDSTLDDLRAMHAGKTGALFAAALLIPKDLAGLFEDSAKNRSIDLFAAELGLAFQVADDLDDAATESRQPTNVLYYLSEREARSSTAAGLNRAVRDLVAAWGDAGADLASIGEEVARKLVPRKPVE